MGPIHLKQKQTIKAAAMHEYYRTQSPITDPGPYVTLFASLPDSPVELINIVQGLIIYKLEADAYNISLSQNQRTEQHLRTMRQILQRIHDLDSAPLTKPRQPQDRIVGVCRDFALFLTSMLRYQSTPARMRVGFASYLDPEGVMKYDHWVTEYWDDYQVRWILVDPQIDDIQRKAFQIKIREHCSSI
jgi:hypothetical protein